MELSAADANSRRSATVGDEIVVRLPETPTSGYQWLPEIDPSALQVVDDTYEFDQNRRGGSGVHRFTFRALREGPTLLKLVNRRPWEQQGSEEYRVDLRIRR
ncbi:hypothetical protein GCM10010472_71570 [Pseudonocardia halophobica]|uniref:Proteinase inhibitor I42 chagasin domain-containing protein n=1 Tax=Pseudonocardia halophobica TaxID=29401 RepID=A0A9W6L2K8_9PSEU|nr:protease inhibitor I42 family protein [Pseudonocardia halophobica]GLL10971.1 hypothetical protein GCM10017577_21120 [Pseudonocardia halophobica]